MPKQIMAFERSRSGGVVAFIVPLLGICLFLSYLTALAPAPVRAQEEIGSYTVQSGDTLAVIAERFGVPLDLLIAINNIADRNLISVGQVLLIPAANAELDRLPTHKVLAQPGDTLADMARRYSLDPLQVMALNQLSMTARLFPGQPIAIPYNISINETLRFGAIEQISVPTEVVQGRTGQLTIVTRHPISPVTTWDGRPLVLLPLPVADQEQQRAEAGTDSQGYAALIPVHALLTPATYTLTIGYTTTHGIFVHQERQINVLAGPYASQEIILPEEKTELLAPEISEAEQATVTAIWSVVTPQWRWTDLFTRPIGNQYATTSPFGTRRSYNGGPYDNYHTGQDFGAPEGTPIIAPAAGRVAFAGPLQIRGNAVIIDHGAGIFTGYWHLSELHVTEGQEVGAGDLLGLVGTTGRSTGAHLHWELRIDGIAVDPLQFFAEPLLSP